MSIVLASQFSIVAHIHVLHHPYSKQVLNHICIPTKAFATEHLDPLQQQKSPPCLIGH